MQKKDPWIKIFVSIFMKLVGKMMKNRLESEEW